MIGLTFFLSSCYPPSAVTLPPHWLPRLDLGALGLGAGIVLCPLPRPPRFRNTARWLSSPDSAASALLCLRTCGHFAAEPEYDPRSPPPPQAVRCRRCPEWWAGCGLCAASIAWLNSVLGGAGEPVPAGCPGFGSAPCLGPACV